MGDYTLMRQRIIDTNWETLINDELDVNNACLNFTNVFLTIAKECISTRKYYLYVYQNVLVCQ
jgi:hypothetical protein